MELGWPTNENDVKSFRDKFSRHAPRYSLINAEPPDNQWLYRKNSRAGQNLPIPTGG